MPVHEYFASSYSEARAKFRSAAALATANVTPYSLANLPGPENEILTIDVAQLGNTNPNSLLILISGTHGAEGSCGSGCQVGYFADELYRALPSEAGVILIHALNPFGFAWLRRGNEDNVDLNRNFQDFPNLPSSAKYDALHDWLVPKERGGDEQKSADAKLLEYIARNTLKVAQAEITGGQYSKDTGLFYGGKAESWSNGILRKILTDHVKPKVRRLAVLDFHTGLGKPGFGEPIYLGPTTEGFELAKKWYGEEVRSTLQGSAVFAALAGSIADALPRLTPGFEVTYLALEFGTVSEWEVLTALRADAWLHAVPNRVTQMRAAIKRQIRDAFYIDTPWWKAAVYGRSADFAIRASRALRQS
jgi:hypothetical protein